ncbi:hypothetical protein [Parasutterella sp.]|uniref:hypothetical protein n=1 Tax=Parasutterella sp. TaxID=2049037 RepID=UPI003AEFD740
MRGIGKFVVKEIRAYSGQPISEVPIGKLFAYTVIDNKPDSGISTIAISKLGVTARLANPDGKEIEQANRAVFVVGKRGNLCVSLYQGIAKSKQREPVPVEGQRRRKLGRVGCGSSKTVSKLVEKIKESGFKAVIGKKSKIDKKKTACHKDFLKGFKQKAGFSNSWDGVLSHYGSGWECHGGAPDLGKRH